MKFILRAVVLALLGLPLFAVAQTYWRSASNSGISDNILGVAFGNGLFAATTDQGNVLTSPDGLVWTRIPVTPGVALSAITCGNGLWVAVGDQGTVATSVDLATWSRINTGTSAQLNAVAYSGANVSGSPSGIYYVAVGADGTVLNSVDGKAWITLPKETNAALTGVASGYFDTVVCGQNGVTLDKVVAGYPSTVVTAGASYNLAAIASGSTNPQTPGASCVAVGGGGTIITSPLAVSGMVEMAISAWTRVAAPTQANLWGISYGNRTFLAVGDAGTIIISSDAENWTQQFPGSSYQSMCTASLRAAAFSASLQRFVVVGNGGTILVSDAPQAELANVSARGTVSGAEPLIGGFVVSGEGIRTVLVRADGPALATFGVSAPLLDPVLTVYDSNQQMVATNSGWSTQSGADGVAAAAASVGAFTLPDGSPDSALLLTLAPGAYTAVISSASGNAGTALFEAYVY